jgi:hypothetical protein
MALEIPKEDAGSITAIQTLSHASMEKFISALTTAPLTSNPDEMVTHIAKRVPSIPKDQLTRMLGTIYTLYHIRELAGVEHSQFLDDLMEAIQQSPTLQLSQKETPKLRSLLERLLNIDSLNMVAKAGRLQRDGERLFCTAKILSDIRPVFSSDPAGRPIGAVLTHTLKVGYHDGKEHREFHVVLDSSDLDQFGDTIQRAQAKDKSLRGLLRSIDLPNLGD